MFSLRKHLFAKKIAFRTMHCALKIDNPQFICEEICWVLLVSACGRARRWRGNARRQPVRQIGPENRGIAGLPSGYQILLQIGYPSFPLRKIDHWSILLQGNARWGRYEENGPFSKREMPRAMIFFDINSRSLFQNRSSVDE